MNYYLHRISHHKEWSYPLLEHRNLLSIGWSDFGAKPEFVSEHQGDWSRVADTVEHEFCKVRSRFGLQRFLEMEQGDRVVVPTWGAFHVYEIADDERLVPTDIEDELKGLRNWQGNSAVIRERYMKTLGEKDPSVDLGFFRRVKQVELGISREEYADATLTSRMKVRQANVQITELSESIEDSIRRHQNQQPINLRRQVLDKCESAVRDTILDVQNPDQFEKLIARYFECLGANAEIPAKNEPGKKGDADIIATFESLKLIVYVQAKRHDDGETDEFAVEQIKQYADYKKNSGSDEEFTQLTWVVSTAEKFSATCQNDARKSGVRLIDGKEFARMLLDTGIERLHGL